MSQNGGDESARTRAKSCVECRRRKIRCVWSSTRGRSGGNGRAACDHCLARGQACITQNPAREAASGGGRRITAGERISHLEQELASLASIVRQRPGHDSPGSSHLEDGIGSGTDTFLDDLEEDPDLVEVESSNRPFHLRILFDGLAADSEEDRHSESDRKSAKVRARAMQVVCSKLKSLIPLREQISIFVHYASDWMQLYHALFPAFATLHSADQLTSSFDGMHSEQASPIALAMYLLCIAITVQQVPPSRMPVDFYRGRGVTRYVDTVCRIVERTVIANNALAGTTEGLETAMLCMRLSLGRSNLKSTWLTFRRIVALAELAGLPQANEEMARLHDPSNINTRVYTDQEALHRRADIWESICATDRNYSMMLNFPAGTARYRFPRDCDVLKDGRVSSQLYNYQLSSISALVFEIDESYAHEASHAKSYEKVLTADRQMRVLASLVPKIWWHNAEGTPLNDLLVQFWHHYVMARIHLRPAMMGELDSGYTYSRITCRDACHQAVRLFPQCRARIPSGFFVCRMLDVQVFTAATCLLLTSRSFPDQQQQMVPASPVPTEIIDLINDVIDCFAHVSDKAGSDMAREARTALVSLITLVQSPESNTSGPLSLQIPLLGKIHIRASTNPNTGLTSPDDPLNEQPQGFSSQDYQANALGPAIPIQQAVDPRNTLAGVPMHWSFEFDDPSFWMRNDTSPESTTGFDSWLISTAMGNN